MPDARLRLHALSREMAPERTRARYGVKQAVQVPRDGMQPDAARARRLDIGKQRLHDVLHGGAWLRRIEEQRVDREQAPRLLIRGAAHHDTVDMGEMSPRLVETGDAAIEDHGQRR